MKSGAFILFFILTSCLDLAPSFSAPLWLIEIREPSISDRNSSLHGFSADTVEIQPQDTLKDEDCEIVDIPDLAKKLFGKKDKEPVDRGEKKVSLLILPNISSNPANGFILGVALVGAVHIGEKDKTKISFFNTSIAYTSKNQFISFLKSSIYTNNNDYYAEGDLRFYKYQAPTFGLGTNSPDTTFEKQHSFLGFELDAASGGFPMLYNYVIVHQIVNKKIQENLYVGFGYHLDAYWNIKDENLRLDTIPAQLTPHWGYSKMHGFDSSRYTLSGLSANFMYDSRDNQINPYEGYYFKVNYRYNPEFLGSSKASSKLWVEFRTYVRLSRKIPRHLIAFWALGSFQTTGVQPYYTLFATADDQKARTGRGYIAGRYRGENLIYAETEYRFPLLPCSQTLGGVVFVNATTATHNQRNVKLFDYVRPAIGFGFRVLFNKHTRLNINIDYAIGYKSEGFYFAGGETF